MLPLTDNWKSILEWADEENKLLFEELRGCLTKTFPDVIDEPFGYYYCFYRKNKTNYSRFLAIIMHKHDLSIRVRVDSLTIDQHLLLLLKERIYKGYFFKIGRGKEREFKLVEPDQIKKIWGIIVHSYRISSKPRF